VGKVASTVAEESPFFRAVIIIIIIIIIILLQLDVHLVAVDHTLSSGVDYRWRYNCL
jgi:hypothetical protein